MNKQTQQIFSDFNNTIVEYNNYNKLILTDLSFNFPLYCNT